LRHASWHADLCRGETMKTITIAVSGDSKKEATETFFIDQFGASVDSLMARSRGTGYITNDD
jgi:hypothetical protein